MSIESSRKPNQSSSSSIRLVSMRKYYRLSNVTIWLNQNTDSILHWLLCITSTSMTHNIEWFVSPQAVPSAWIPLGRGPCSNWLMNGDVPLIEIIRTIDPHKSKIGVFIQGDCELNCGLSSIPNERKSKMCCRKKWRAWPSHAYETFQLEWLLRGTGLSHKIAA